jgi:uncharacterized protein YjbI with pentapeptide repeats
MRPGNGPRPKINNGTARKPKNPDLPDPDKLIPATEFDPFDEDLYDSIHIGQCVCGNREASHVVMEHSIFERVDFTQSRLKRLEISDVDFRRCDFAAITFDDLDVQRVQFLACRMLGIKIIEGQLVDFSCQECQMEFAQLRYSMLKGSYFNGCILKDADFSGADLRGATFDRCDLTGASFLNSNLSGCDLRSSVLDNAHIGQESLQGAIVTPFQAVAIASVFGLKVLSEEEEIK